VSIRTPCSLHENTFSTEGEGGGRRERKAHLHTLVVVQATPPSFSAHWRALSRRRRPSFLLALLSRRCGSGGRKQFQSAVPSANEQWRGRGRGDAAERRWRERRGVRANVVAAVAMVAVAVVATADRRFWDGLYYSAPIKRGCFLAVPRLGSLRRCRSPTYYVAARHRAVLRRRRAAWILTSTANVALISHRSRLSSLRTRYSDVLSLSLSLSLTRVVAPCSVSLSPLSRSLFFCLTRYTFLLHCLSLSLRYSLVTR